ncbi:MAG: glycosyltransferase, partial [Thermoanaerobaculia bacterium]
MKAMKVLLANVGTAGDVFPFVGLGAALRARGHQAVLLGPESFADLARKHGLGFEPLLPAEEERVLADPVFWDPLRGPLVAARWGARLFEG